MESEIKVTRSGKIILPRIEDARDGILGIGEAGKQIPFEIKRFYFITNLDSQASIRGMHAHRKLNQVIFSISGSFILSLDDGSAKQDILMNKENVGILLGPGLWHTMHDFTNGCVILVIASDFYQEADYIRSYDSFIQLNKEGFWK